mmetsp:Transcript_7535/g.11272  ORF Transcript_7535/g.11272 Transcript_7535/m.11272 type:complete len:192 (+) Transcript_7535:49-624(+)|eukprot:CAMPEP_0171460046 /NCGR_PEP_ID=MMETSP0945-20130129/5071_1 /TAXON_ID=109269 /ORGANISM="Vaucheria litorea, Strain CCMP2940" /LENGTH=191 /DNA_ID=CAMNT_0011986155 /DNA_START=45 /DNA_END=620 /DNA_ORIENTATION=-
MDSLFAIAGKGFVVLAADSQVARSILLYQSDLDKIKELDEHKLLAMAGPQADCSVFGEYIHKNMTLYELNHDLTLNTHATANFIRKELAKALRKGPYQVNSLLGGVDGDVASLYWIDYLGTLHKVDYGAQGYASNFTLSLLNNKYRPGMSEEEAIELTKKCFKELETRFLISQTKYVIKVVNKEGIKTVLK